MKSRKGTPKVTRTKKKDTSSSALARKASTTKRERKKEIITARWVHRSGEEPLRP